MNQSANAPDGATLAQGSGGRLVAAGAVWAFGTAGGDRMAPVLRDGIAVGRAARLLWRGGAIYAQDADGGWTRFDGGTWRTVLGVGPHEQPEPAKPAVPSAEPLCVVCGATATRIMDGGTYCFRHSPHSPRPGDPPPPCAVCEQPSDRREYGIPFCPAHSANDPPPQAA